VPVSEAVVFDVMGTVFDLSSLRERLAKVGAPAGALEAWFGRMLHGAATLTLVGDFHPFRGVASSTLASVLEQVGGDVDRRDEVLEGLGELDPYPDAEIAFARLREAGVRIATLTNGGEQHTRGLLERARLADAVELVITVDEVRAYKPHAAPYRHAASRLGLPLGRITLVAAHGWDIVGANAAGMNAVWVERLERRWPFPTAEPSRAADLIAAAELVLSGSR
jgi:2-haloacid dehalogenase